MSRIFGCVLFVSLIAFGQDAALRKLEAEMERVSRIGGGVVGAAAIHVETGRMAQLNGAAQFPMASTFKIPVAVTLLELVDRGEEQLDRMVTIEARDLHPGSGTLSRLFTRPGVALSVHNLLELMMLISDNSATDVLLRLVGGPDAVTAKMGDLGLAGIHVDRATAGLIADHWGVTKLPLELEWSPAMWKAAYAATTEAQRSAAAVRFNSDARDTATPVDMARLLVRIQKRELHKPATAELLVDILKRCQTGEARLKGILPEGTVVAHKTGSMGTAIANDVGIIALPGGASHVALAVYLKASDKPAAATERTIAEIARAAHDFFLFQ
jgi:beta-lactamase class A